MSSSDLSLSIYTLGAVLFLGTTAGRAAEASDPPRWELSEDGSTALDQKTRLAWARCVEGMTWNGKTCTGKALTLDLTQAQARAKSRAAQDGLRWRLPHVTELQRLYQSKDKHLGPETQWFSDTPAAWHWTATVSIDNRPVNAYRYANVERALSEENTNRIAFLHGWAYHSGTGETASEMPRREHLVVRLVRSAR